MKKIPTPKISKILKQEFVLPFNLPAYSLANFLGIPTSRIEDILHDRRQITADTSIRLGRFFGVSDRYFLNLQTDLEFRNAEAEHGNEYNAIRRQQIRD
ncbi:MULTISPECIES: HigA family addiction module antitoxin [Lacticaseibacillus]|uniref:HigA family addiction module antitoxin n=1 Tax=Lacticaseibacillus TaxID=2759736 RepID=UPI00063D9E76|nr:MULTISPECIES: HigA family addiction module antitoxin [Lacticaseibacillus]KLI75325.1 toxin-antitoxin system antitoxin subunit [Lacticaseibacillus casei]